MNKGQEVTILVGDSKDGDFRPMGSLGGTNKNPLQGVDQCIVSVLGLDARAIEKVGFAMAKLTGTLFAPMGDLDKIYKIKKPRKGDFLVSLTFIGNDCGSKPTHTAEQIISMAGELK